MTQKTNVGSSKNLLKTSNRIVRNWRVLAVFGSLAVFPVTAVISIQSALAQARVPVSSALKLYGNAVNSGLCKTLSEAKDGNLWVCELTGSDPDVHLTVSDRTNLHLTVRTPPGKPTCEGSSWLVGNWPRGLTFNQHEPREICKVNLKDYLARINNVEEKFQDCIAAFNAAGERQLISERVKNSYIDKCKKHP